MTNKSHEADVAFIKALAELLRANDLTELQVKREYGEDDSLDVHQKKLIADKRKEYEERQQQTPDDTATAPADKGSFPADAQLCNKCNVKAAILMDGCYTCLNCGDSKCG